MESLISSATQNNNVQEAPLQASEENSLHRKKNLYPAVRHILLIVFVLFGLAFIVFLMHQNGKSIYDNGL